MTTLKDWQVPNLTKRSVFVQQSIDKFSKTVSEKGFEVNVIHCIGLNVVAFHFKSHAEWLRSKEELKNLHCEVVSMQHWQSLPHRMVVIFKTESEFFTKNKTNN